MTTAETKRLQPFGLDVSFPPGTPWSSLEPAQLRSWVDEHRVVRIRGLARIEAYELARQARRLGPLQPWRFGAVHELKQDRHAKNYLYTERAVPLHWDGAFADAVPHWLVFHCVQAPPDDAGGETVFVDTPSILARTNAEERARWERTRVRYCTEKKAHYGGTFVSPVIAKHPTLGIDVLRYAEPVDDLNPVSVEPLGEASHEAAELMAGLSRALADPRSVLALPWAEGDVVVADNHALLHGRRAFRDTAPRHLRRVNVLDRNRTVWALLRASWRVRRPEFFRAELPILLIPLLLCASSFRDFVSTPALAGAAVFFLLFNVGDMINCWLDREVDLHRKTHLAEAVSLLGRSNLRAQVVLSLLAALGLCVYLAVSLGRWWLAAAGLIGAVLAWQYTAPPLRLKSRGLLQILAYMGLLFVGPMLLISGLLVPLPEREAIIAFLGFAAMQTGVLLVNNAEDLDEDEREEIQTASTVLGAQGAVTLALALVLTGGTLLTFTLGLQMHGWRALGAAPLLAVTAWNGLWLEGLRRRMNGQSETVSRETVRDEAKHVPRRVEAGAWAAFLAALTIFLMGAG